MSIQHNSNKFTLEKHQMTKKASSDLTSQCCLINRPVYSAGILSEEKVRPRAEMPCQYCLSTAPLCFLPVPVPLTQSLTVFEKCHLKCSKELIHQRARIQQRLFVVKNMKLRWELEAGTRAAIYQP